MAQTNLTAKTGFTSPLGTQVYINSGVVGVTFNLIQDTGSSNALAGALKDIAGDSVSLATGLRLSLRTANDITINTATTFNLNAGGTKVLGRQTRPGFTLSTTIVAGAIVDMVYDGTQWEVIGY